MKKKALKILIPSLIAVVVLLVGLIFTVKSAITPLDYEDNTLFTVNDGDYGKTVFTNLEEQGILKSGNLAYIYISKLTSEPTDFKAGSYLLSSDMSLKDIVETLCDTSKIYRPTTEIQIIEGETVEEIAKTLSENLDVSYDEIMNYWDDETIVKTYFSDYPFLTDEIFKTGVRHYLEGYLFPSTYTLYIDSSLDEVTRKFLDQTENIYEKYKDEFVDAPTYYNWENGREQKMSIHEIFTLASICQWESGNAEDMPEIAGIFYNRLNDTDEGSAKLYSNVTACYAQGLYKTDCIAVDDSLEMAYDNSEENQYYNTYIINDLPVSPICNPGEAAISAVLKPNETNNYYFVGYCGETYYSTKAQGNAVLKKYNTGC